jgi:DNA repair protein RadC
MNNNTQFHITDFFEAERPRERWARLGPKSLSKAELAAILTRVGLMGENAVLITQQRYSGG